MCEKLCPWPEKSRLYSLNSQSVNGSKSVLVAQHDECSSSGCNNGITGASTHAPFKIG